jgi:hypothetical protein
MFFDQLSLVASHVQAITPHIAPESNDNPTAVVDAPDTIEDPLIWLTPLTMRVTTQTCPFFMTIQIPKFGE